MHRITTRLALALALTVAGLGLATPATARQTAAVSTPSNAFYLAQQQVCVRDHTEGFGIPVATATGYWDRNSAIYLKHEMYVYGQDCRLGYPTGAILDVWASHVTGNTSCYIWQGNTYVQGAGGRWYRSKTTVILNLAATNCWSTSTRRAHYASRAIGVWLGKSTFNGSGSVMANGTWDSIGWATVEDGHGVAEKYYFWTKI